MAETIGVMIGVKDQQLICLRCDAVWESEHSPAICNSEKCRGQASAPIVVEIKEVKDV